MTKQNHSVCISLGGANHVGIDHNDDLSFIHEGPKSKNRFILGRATIARIEALQEYLERLKVHAVEESS